MKNTLIFQQLFDSASWTYTYLLADSVSKEAEMMHNPRVGRGRTKDEFIKIMNDLDLAYPKKIDEALPANQACGKAHSRGGMLSWNQNADSVQKKRLT